MQAIGHAFEIKRPVLHVDKLLYQKLMVTTNQKSISLTLLESIARLWSLMAAQHSTPQPLATASPSSPVPHSRHSKLFAVSQMELWRCFFISNESYQLFA